MSENKGTAGEFRPESPLYRGVRWLIGFIFPPAFRVIYGYRVAGRVPKEAMEKGCVSVCNHVHMLDCVMIACAFREYTMQFLTLASNLKIPLAGLIVRLMGGIPLPAELSGWKDVYRRVEKAFEEGQMLQVYPEGELQSGCRTLRPFRPGAFTFAVKYQKPVIPCVLRFYPRYRKNGKRRRDGRELVIMEPVLPDPKLRGRAAAQELEKQVRMRMEDTLQKTAVGEK